MIIMDAEFGVRLANRGSVMVTSKQLVWLQRWYHVYCIYKHLKTKTRPSWNCPNLLMSKNSNQTATSVFYQSTSTSMGITGRSIALVTALHPKSTFCTSNSKKASITESTRRSVISLCKCLSIQNVVTVTVRMNMWTESPMFQSFAMVFGCFNDVLFECFLMLFDLFLDWS